MVTKELKEFRPELRLKLATTVGGYRQWYFETCNPTGGEFESHGICSLVWHREGFRPAGEAINTHEQVELPVGRGKGTNNVYMYLVESEVRGFECRKWCYCVALNLRPLAW